MNVSWAMNQKIQWSTQTGELDAHAQPIMRPMGTISARVMRKVMLVKNKDGIDVATDTQVHVLDPVQVGDKITHNGRERMVIAVGDGLGLYDTQPSFFILYL